MHIAPSVFHVFYFVISFFFFKNDKSARWFFFIRTPNLKKAPMYLILFWFGNVKDAFELEKAFFYPLFGFKNTGKLVLSITKTFLRSCSVQIIKSKFDL